MAIVKNEWKRLIEFFNNENLIGVLVGVVIGGSFGQMIKSFVTNVFYPSLDYIPSKKLLKDRFITVRPGKNYPYITMKDAVDDGASVIAWGFFTESLTNLLIQGICVFYFIRIILGLHKIQKKIIN